MIRRSKASLQFLSIYFGTLGAFWVQTASNNPTRFGVIDQVRLSEILVRVDPLANTAEVESANKTAEAIIDRMRRGNAFADEARDHSGGSTAAQGGDIGYFRQGVLAKQIEDQVLDMKIGEITNVIRTKQGFVILEVTGRLCCQERNSIPHSSVDILTDREGVDFGPYLKVAIQSIRQKWYSLMPSEVRAPVYKSGMTSVIFSVQKDGSVKGIRVADSSRDASLDRAAVSAITTSSPFAPLPQAFPKDSLTLRFRFLYSPDRKVSSLEIAPQSVSLPK